MPNEKYGAGKDWNVYEDPENAYLLIKEAKNPGLEPSKSMMQRLYLGKILHILFPHNIPDVYAVSAEKGAKLKVQKIILDGESDAIRKLYQDKSITDKSTEFNFKTINPSNNEIISHPFDINKQTQLLVNAMAQFFESNPIETNINSNDQSKKIDLISSSIN